MGMTHVWEDDAAMDHAKELLAADADEIKARLVALAIRSSQQAEAHAVAMAEQSGYSTEVTNLARLLSKYPDLVEPVDALVRKLIQQKLDAIDTGTPPLDTEASNGSG